MQLTLRLAIASLAFFAAPSVASAVPTNYTIAVTVTSAPLAPGSFPTNQWSIPSVPKTYVGTFDADDAGLSVASNLSLLIGGVDIASAFPVLFINLFDPTTSIFYWLANDSATTPHSGIRFSPFGAPLDYVSADEFSAAGTVLDQYNFNLPLNWAGTYQVTKTASNFVPEPETFWLLAGGLFWIGALGIFAPQRSRVQ